jgi:prepilin-type N-terminal cleavage/methylation domain-containing protein
MKRAHNNRGMSLVELLVVMAILAVVMLAVMSLYVPAHQSTVAQSQVSDVQRNLRLAVKVMTRDLLTAGFLVPTNPVIFEASATPTTAENPDPADFTVRTRIVGSDFARITNVSPITGGYQLTVSDADMVDHFPTGSRVRLFEPIIAAEVLSGTGTDAQRAYIVTSSSGDKIEINTSAVPGLSATDILAETVVVRIRDESQPPLQTIRYRLNNGALERVVNGATQILARNIDTSDTTLPGGTSFFDCNFKTSEGRVERCDIRLTARTRALKNDAISGEKTRRVETTVKLRNVY